MSRGTYESTRWRIWSVLGLLCWGVATTVSSAVGTNTEQIPFHGRIAYSCDGNHNDPDDWAASPVTLAILAEAGLKDRLVHFDYNCILPLTDAEWEKIARRERAGHGGAVRFRQRHVL